VEALEPLAADQGLAPRDELLAAAYRASAKKFGAKIVEERVFEDVAAAGAAIRARCRRSGKCQC